MRVNGGGSSAEYAKGAMFLVVVETSSGLALDCALLLAAFLQKGVRGVSVRYIAYLLLHRRRVPARSIGSSYTNIMQLMIRPASSPEEK